MKAYKLDEKKFLEQSIISNVQGLLSSDWYNPHDPNIEMITTHAKNLSLEMLKQRNELFFVEKKTPKSKEPEIKQNIDFEEIVTIFNQVCSMLPSVTKLTPERENAIIKILETYSLQDIGTVFRNVAQSDYLVGKKVEWKATFDWIFIPKNFIKILENGYQNVNNGQTNTTNQYTPSDSLKEKVVGRLFG
jgi:hypothetical protein